MGMRFSAKGSSPWQSGRDPLKLAIDAVGAKHGGATAILRSFVEAVLSWPEVTGVVVFGSKGVAAHLPEDAPCRVAALERPSNENPAGRLLWHVRGFRAAVEAAGADVAISLSGAAVGPGGTASFPLIQQSLPFYPEVVQRGSGAERLRLFTIRTLMRRAALSSRLVLVQTETMRGRVCRTFGLHPERVAVVPPGTGARDAATEEVSGFPQMEGFPETGRVLYVGNGSFYKNLGTLREGFRLLRRRGVNARLFATLSPRELGAPPEWATSLGQLRPSEVALAYRAATVVILPSLAETVGLPGLEAQASGTPVVAADRDFAREVYGEGATYFEPENAEDLAGRLATLLCDETARESSADRGRRNARRFEPGVFRARLRAAMLGATFEDRFSKTARIVDA